MRISEEVHGLRLKARALLSMYRVSGLLPHPAGTIEVWRRVGPGDIVEERKEFELEFFGNVGKVCELLLGLELSEGFHSPRHDPQKLKFRVET